MKTLTIKIKSSSRPTYWYKDIIGQIIKDVVLEGRAYWLLEENGMRSVRCIEFHDAEVVQADALGNVINIGDSVMLLTDENKIIDSPYEVIETYLSGYVEVTSDIEGTKRTLSHQTILLQE